MASRSRSRGRSPRTEEGNHLVRVRVLFEDHEEAMLFGIMKRTLVHYVAELVSEATGLEENRFFFFVETPQGFRPCNRNSSMASLDLPERLTCVERRLYTASHWSRIQ